jgi:hypothetical protein
MSKGLPTNLPEVKPEVKQVFEELESPANEEKFLEHQRQAENQNFLLEHLNQRLCVIIDAVIKNKRQNTAVKELVNDIFRSETQDA